MKSAGKKARWKTGEEWESEPFWTKIFTAAFDALDPIAVVKPRNGFEHWPDELTNPPEK